MKILFLSSEIDPFANSYDLAIFAKKLTISLHHNKDLDLRLMHPKYGFISDRKYILREVIRLRDLELDFNGQKISVNLKSGFIPNSRVQVYFVENQEYFKNISELIYKSKNGRIYLDNLMRFCLFDLVVLETMKKLFWAPDVIICNDLQSSMVPIMLKNKYKTDDFYSNTKIVSIFNSINKDFRYFTDKEYNALSLESAGKKNDNLVLALENSDLSILFNYKDQIPNKFFNRNKSVKQVFEKNKGKIINLDSSISDVEWNSVSEQLLDILKKIVKK
tara:strand:+ start:515 stop:1342 length:828 start_codon:yes stop_codon:yes gene_type:complete